MQTVIFKVDQVPGGYSAYCADFNILTEGDTEGEVKERCLEALELYCEETGRDPRELEILAVIQESLG